MTTSMGTVCTRRRYDSSLRYSSGGSVASTRSDPGRAGWSPAEFIRRSTPISPTCPMRISRSVGCGARTSRDPATWRRRVAAALPSLGGAALSDLTEERRLFRRSGPSILASFPSCRDFASRGYHRIPTTCCWTWWDRRNIRNVARNFALLPILTIAPGGFPPLPWERSHASAASAKRAGHPEQLQHERWSDFMLARSDAPLCERFWHFNGGWSSAAWSAAFRPRCTHRTGPFRAACWSPRQGGRSTAPL